MPLKFEYDPRIDVLTVEGVRYSGEAFRDLALAKAGTCLQIVRNEDGVITFQMWPGRVTSGN